MTFSFFHSAFFLDFSSFQICSLRHELILPSGNLNSPFQNFDILKNTDCVLILIRTALSNINREHNKPATLDALELLRNKM